MVSYGKRWGWARMVRYNWVCIARTTTTRATQAPISLGIGAEVGGACVSSSSSRASSSSDRVVGGAVGGDEDHVGGGWARMGKAEEEEEEAEKEGGNAVGELPTRKVSALG